MKHTLDSTIEDKTDFIDVDSKADANEGKANPSLIIAYGGAENGRSHAERPNKRENHKSEEVIIIDDDEEPPRQRLRTLFANHDSDLDVVSLRKAPNTKPPRANVAGKSSLLPFVISEKRGLSNAIVSDTVVQLDHHILDAETSISTEKRPPLVVLLVGCPGAGKSAFAKKLLSVGWRRVCQDEVKNRVKCEKNMQEYLDKSFDVVVDRCNMSADQRELWIQIAKQSKAMVGCILFALSEEECVQRVLNRKEHETITSDTPEARVRSIVRAQAFSFEVPTGKEGVSFLRVIRSKRDADETLLALLS